MKCIFQEGIGSSEGRDLWLDKSEIDALDILGKIKSAYHKNRSCYYTTHFTSNNKSYYPFFFIDFDSKDVQQSLDSTKLLIRYFFEMGIKEENLFISFSGSKGFHILLDTRCLFANIPTKEEFPHYVQKKIALLLHKNLEQFGLIRPDFKIYSKTRKIRGLFSKHQISGLYKTPVTINDLENLNLEKIYEKAKSPNFSIPNNTDSSLSFFTSPANFSTELSKLLAQAIEETALNKTIVPRNANPKNKSSSNKDYKANKKDMTLPSTSLASLSCRAIRKNAESIIRTESADGQKRRLLASSLQGTDHRDAFVLKILRNDKEFKKETTEAKLYNLNAIASCENLIENGFCTEKCSRYIKKNGDEANTPIQFGENGMGLWNTITSPTSISDTAFRLRNYHRTTTDLFDWANCDQFLENPDIYSYAISDYLRKGKTPSFKNYITSVRKDKTKLRDLSYVHFEYELILGLFVDAGLKSNKKFKDEHVSSQIIYSFGYQDYDLERKSLIKSWQEEYKDYKATLESISRSKEWPIVYSDDIKDFYPSFNFKYIQSLVSTIFRDERIEKILGDLYSQSWFDFESGEKHERFFGLSQGPLLSHVIACRALLELDKVVSDNFNSDELRLVRYCDDIVFFIRDEEVLNRLKTGVIKEIQDKIHVTFHNDPESGKTFQDNIDEYIDKRLTQDLYKYQIKFETELASIDPQTKEDLVRLIKEIFGNTLNKFLANDQLGNLKDLERAINTLSWKIPKLYDDKNQEVIANLKELCEKILIFLEDEHIGHKMRANLSSLLISIISFYGSRFDDIMEKMVLLYSSEKIKSGSRFCLIVQLQSFLSFNPKNISLKKVQEIIDSLKENYSNIEIFNFYLIPGLQFKLDQVSNREFNFALWPMSSDSVFPNLSSYIKNIQLAISGNDNELEMLFHNTDSSAVFYSKYLIKYTIDKFSDFSIKYKHRLYKLARHYLIPDLEEIFWKDIEQFSEQGLLTETEKTITEENSNTLTQIINDSFQLPNTPISISKRVRDINIYSNGTNFFIIRKLQPILKKGINLSRIQSIATVLNKLDIGEIRIEKDKNSSKDFLLYMLPQTSSLNHWLYIDKSNSIGDIVEVEINFFKHKVDKLSPIILSAKNLGIYLNNGSKGLFLFRPDDVIIDTVSQQYSHYDNSKLKINKMGRALLPEGRFYDFIKLFLKTEIENEFGKIGKRTIDQLKPNRPSSYYYRSPSKLVSVLKDLSNYKKWLEENKKENFKGDSSKNTIYQIFDWYYTNSIHVQPLHFNESKKASFYPRLQKSQAIFEQVFIDKKLTTSLKNILDNLHDYDKLDKLNFYSIDQLVGYSLCSTAYCGLYQDKYGLGNEILFIGLIGASWLHNCFVELKVKLGLDDFDEIINYLHESRKAFIQKFKSNYPSPLKDLSDNIVLEYTVFFDELRNHLIKLNVKGIQSYKLSDDSHFTPPFSSDNQIRLTEVSNHLKTFKLNFKTKPAGVIQHITFKALNYIDYNEYKEYYLHSILSNNHRWQADSNEFFQKTAHVLKHKDKYILSIYPKFISLAPIKSSKILKIKEHWIYKTTASIIILLIIFFISDVKFEDIKKFTISSYQRISSGDNK